MPALTHGASRRHLPDAFDRHAFRLFETAFALAPIGMGLVDLDGRWLKVNRTLCTLLDYDEAELLERTFQDITHPDDLEADLGHVAELLAGLRQSYEMEKRYFTRGGHQLWVQLSVALVRDEEGDPLHFIAQVLDVSERKRTEQALHHRADRDGLSGVYNRRRFDEELELQVRRGVEFGERGALLLLDVDRFKGLNDRFGHRAGDALIASIGRALRERLRASDVVARYGGDEFAVILRNLGPRHAQSLAEQLAAMIGDLRVAGAEDFVPSVSVGVTTLDEDVTDAEDTLALADAALYRAKGDGRACVRTAVPALQAQ